MNKTLLIVEGPDRTGKTSYCERLSHYFSVPVYKSGREKEACQIEGAQFNILKWATFEQLKMVEQLKFDVIFDRFFPSEFVYSKTLGRASDHDLVFSYDEWWKTLGGKIIFLDASVEEKDWDDDLISYEKFSSLRQNYEEYRRLTKCSHLVTDTTDVMNFEKNLAEMIKFVER